LVRGRGASRSRTRTSNRKTVGATATSCCATPGPTRRRQHDRWSVYHLRLLQILLGHESIAMSLHYAGQAAATARQGARQSSPVAKLGLATIFLPPPVAQPVEAVRQEWDPAMADQIAAHVTVAYPSEVHD